VKGENDMAGTKIAKTVDIPVDQLIKAHRLIDKIHKELLNLGNRDWVNKIIEELKDCITVTD